MTFYKNVWLIIIVFTLGLQAELLPTMLPVFNYRSLTLGRVVPVSFRTTLGLLQRCYKCHTKHRLIPNYVSTQQFSNSNKIITPHPRQSMKESFRRVYDADTAYVDLESYGNGRFKTASHQKTKMFVNVKPDDNSRLENKISQHIQNIPENYAAVKSTTDSYNSQDLMEKPIDTSHGNGLNVEEKPLETGQGYGVNVEKNPSESGHGNSVNSGGKHYENHTVVHNTQSKDSKERIEDPVENILFAQVTAVDAFENITDYKINDNDVEDKIYKQYVTTLNQFEGRLLARQQWHKIWFPHFTRCDSQLRSTNQEHSHNFYLHQCRSFSVNVSKYVYEQKNIEEASLKKTNFDKFTSMAASKGDSGMSFVQSGLFLGLVLSALSTEVDIDTKDEIDQNLRLNVSNQVKVKLIKQVISSLPESTEQLKFRWASRLVLRSTRQLSDEFIAGAARALHLKVDHFEGTETPEAMAKVLNKMIEADSGGSIRDTFEEDDLTQDEEAVLITTLYFRARWRSSPTLLNGTRPFQDSSDVQRTVRMIRINDVMNYLDLPEWDAEAIEISYSTEGLSLLMLIPRGNSIKGLVKHVTTASISAVTERMQNIRVAVVLPLYTLRMTLLLPNKLQAMGMSRLVDVNRSEVRVDQPLRLSQAVQRIMFWAEAGRNAYKDDGLEWDEPPNMKMVIDRPYMFFVRWQNMTLMNGNFVL